MKKAVSSSMFIRWTKSGKEPIRIFVPINLILLYLLIILTYFVIRLLVEIEDVEARKVLMINVGCGLFIIFAIWTGFKMMVYGLRGFVR